MTCEACREAASVGQDRCDLCAYEAGQAAECEEAVALAYARGAWGRGSRARYRRAVEMRLKRWERDVRDSMSVVEASADSPWAFDAAMRAIHVSRAERHQRAIARARKLLRRLDGEGT